MKTKWVRIADDKVRHIWKCEEDDCDFNNPTANISPDFYGESGNPVCECDAEMTYQYTEIQK